MNDRAIFKQLLQYGLHLQASSDDEYEILGGMDEYNSFSNLIKNNVTFSQAAWHRN